MQIDIKGNAACAYDIVEFGPEVGLMNEEDQDCALVILWKR